MKIPTVLQMQSIDRNAVKEYGIPGIVLMENAGLKVLEVIKDTLVTLSGKRIIILAGKGNNGGDGFVIARHLHNNGAKVVTFFLGTSEQLPEEALCNYKVLNNIKAQLWHLQNDLNMEKLQLALLKADLVVDAIYGSGFKGLVTGLEAELIKTINESEVPVIAVDIPSGVEADTGFVVGQAIRAKHTVTFALPKLGLLLEPGAAYTGKLTVSDISIPADLLVDPEMKYNLLTSQRVQTFIKPRSADAHKGDFGFLLAVGGSLGMSGAITLASQSALKTGSGLVTAAIPESVLNLVAAAVPEVMTVPLPETAEGQISINAAAVLLDYLHKASVCVMGPGLGSYQEAHDVVSLILKESDIPVVIDADGLNAVKDDISMFAHRSAPVILTPHPGELSRLTGLSIEEIQENRINTAQEFAQKNGVVLVLKGNKTIIALPDGEVFINLTGNPGMATAGSGDVLAGIIGGFLAQGLKAADAALVGVYIHGRAGDRAALDQGQRGLVAGDLIKYLPGVLKEFEMKS